MSDHETPPGDRRGPTPAQDSLVRIFTAGMWVGVALVVGGMVGIVTLPSGPASIAAGAVGVGIVLGFAGLRARRTYREIAGQTRSTLPPRQPTSGPAALRRVISLQTRMAAIGCILLVLGVIAAPLLPSGQRGLAGAILLAGLVMVAGGLAGRRHFKRHLPRASQGSDGCGS